MMNNRTVGLFARRAGSLVWRTISILSFLGCAMTLLIPGLFNSYFLGSEGVRNAVCAAAGRGDIGKLERYHRRNAALDAPCYDGQFTPLSAAALNGRADAVAFLLAKGVSPDSHGSDGRTPLTLAQLHLYAGFQTTPAALKVDRDFSRTSRLLAQAGGATGNARPQVRLSRNPLIQKSGNAEIRRYAFP